MATQEEWLENFKEKTGRNPELNEFLDAKNNDFELITKSNGSSDSSVLKKMTANEWSKKFEDVYDRKATLEEYLNAKTLGFQDLFDTNISEPEPEPEPTGTEEDNGELWLQKFEQVMGKKPTSDEFILAKNTGFPEIEPVESYYEHTQDNLNSSPLNNVQEKTQRFLIKKKDSPNQPRSQKKAGRKKKRILPFIGLGFGIILVVACGITYFIGSQYFSKAAQLSRYVTQYNKNDGKIVKDLSLYEWADTKRGIKKSELKYLGQLPSKIGQNKILEGTKFEKDGSFFVIFPKYKVFVNPQELNISTNTTQLDIYLTNKKIATSDSGNYKKECNRLFPAQYDIKAKGTVKNQQIDLKKSIKLVNGKGLSDFNLKYITFNLYSNVDKGDVYIDASKIGTISNGEFKFVDIPVVGDGDIQVTRTFDSGIIKSALCKVSSVTDGQSVYLNWNQKLDTQTATTLLQNAFSDLAQYAENGEVPSDVSNTFKGGGNNKFFTDIQATIDNNMKKATIPAKKIDFDSINITNIIQTDVNNYAVSFDVRYDFFYDGSDKSNTKGNFYQTFAMNTTVDYHPEGTGENLVTNFLINQLSDTGTLIKKDNQTTAGQQTP